MLYENQGDWKVAISQSFAIAAALETVEDKLYWTASTGLGQSWQYLSEDGQMPEGMFRLRDMQNDLFCQAALGAVHLPNEYKAIIDQLVAKLYSPEVLKLQFQVFDQISFNDEGEE